MLTPFILRRLEANTGQIGSWLTARRLRKARIKRQRQMRWSHRLRRLKRAVLVTSGIFLAALALAIVNDGLADADLILAGLAGVIAFFGFLIFPRFRAPTIHELEAVRLDELGRATEHWLEMQRPLLSGRARSQLDKLGFCLERLTPQLAQLDEREPIAHEIRGLLTNHLPAMVESYIRIPETHRAQPDAAGVTPEARLVNGLAIIEREIDTVSGHISRGEFHELAKRGRYLEIRYQTGMETDGA